MDRYIRHDRVRALRMMEYWEADRERPEQLFGKSQAVSLARDLREFLRANNMLPERPNNWIDPLGEDQLNAIKSWNLEKHVQLMVQNKVEAANRRLEGARLLEKNASLGPSGSVSVTRIQGNHSLVRSAKVGANIVKPGEKLQGRARKKGSKSNKRGSRKTLEKLWDSGILNLTEEDLRGRSVREVVRDVLAGDCTRTATPTVASEREQAKASSPGRPLSSVPILPLSS
jgi:hypothetical protein